MQSIMQSIITVSWKCC